MIIHLNMPPDASRPNRFRRLRRFLIPGLIAGGLAATASAIIIWLSFADSAPAEAASPASMTVALGATREQAWPDTIRASGAVAAWQEVIIGAQIGGLQLREVRVSVGDRVRRGQVLATFDPASPRAEHARLAAVLAQTQALEAQAMAEQRRAEGLAASGAVSAQELLRLATEAESAQANMAAARAALDAQNEQLRYVEVRAPDDGVITARAATPGSLGGLGQELFRMIRQGRLEWRGELTAAQLSRASPGQAVELTLPDGGVALGTIRRIAPSLDPRSRLGLVYADLTGPGGARAGMYAQGRILLPTTPAITAPAAGVVLRDGRHYVFTVSQSGEHLRVKANPVLVGRRQGAEVEILGRLPPNSRIVISGAGFLKEGDLVREGRPATAVPDPAQPGRPTV